jgi:hypothetical protein
MAECGNNNSATFEGRTNRYRACPSVKRIAEECTNGEFVDLCVEEQVRVVRGVIGKLAYLPCVSRDSNMELMALIYAIQGICMQSGSSTNIIKTAFENMENCSQALRLN